MVEARCRHGVLIPEERTTELVKGKKVTKKRKLYPGYLMVEVAFNEKVLALMRDTPGVNDFLGGASLQNPPHPLPEQEVQRMLGACDTANAITNLERRVLKALILTIYDTSHRLGALLKVPRSALDPDGYLSIPAELTKQNADTRHKLAPETITAIQNQLDDDKLFAWPIRQRGIYQRLKAVLDAAGLPQSRRDCFHKLRRTSFTYVMAAQGEYAARSRGPTTI